MRTYSYLSATDRDVRWLTSHSRLIDRRPCWLHHNVRDTVRRHLNDGLVVLKRVNLGHLMGRHMLTWTGPGHVGVHCNWRRLWHHWRHHWRLARDRRIGSCWLFSSKSWLEFCCVHVRRPFLIKFEHICKFINVLPSHLDSAA